MSTSTLRSSSPRMAPRMAVAAAKDFEAAQRDGAIDLIDAAVIVHTADGKVKIDETADPSGKKWAKRGAIAGGVVGLIFPPSIIVSASWGRAGGVWGKIRDKGFKDDDLKEIGNSLPPGSSAIIAAPRTRLSSRWSARSPATRRSPSTQSPPKPPPRSWPKWTMTPSRGSSRLEMLRRRSNAAGLIRLPNCSPRGRA